MAQRTVEDKPDLTIPEDTIVRSKLMEIKDKPIEWTVKSGPDAGKTKSAVLAQMWWEVVEGEYKGRKIKLEVDGTITNHPNNRFRQVAEALLQREIDAGMVVDDEDLVGLTADISIKHREYEKNGQTRIAEEVDEIMSIRTVEGDVPF